MNPSDNSLVDVYYPDYAPLWNEGRCITNRPLPATASYATYPTLVACCEAIYPSQPSGKCLSGLTSLSPMSPTDTVVGDATAFLTELPNPLATSLTDTSGDASIFLTEIPNPSMVDIYYPDYAPVWNEGGCIDIRPLPVDRPTYSTLVACCNAIYPSQPSGKCLSGLTSLSSMDPTITVVGDATISLTELPNLPTTSLTPTDIYYPDYAEFWNDGRCISTRPVPVDRPTYSTLVACCNAIYLGQPSGKCFRLTSSSLVDPTITVVGDATTPLAEAPKMWPSALPSAAPSELLSRWPSGLPSAAPSDSRSRWPSDLPSAGPSVSLSRSPSSLPSAGPSDSLSRSPSGLPSAGPIDPPSRLPSVLPSAGPSVSPSRSPSSLPSAGPIVSSSRLPSGLPSAGPSVSLSRSPSILPSAGPIESPSRLPSGLPSADPIDPPSRLPSGLPSAGPIVSPSRSPSGLPSTGPIESPSRSPSSLPSAAPSDWVDVYYPDKGACINDRPLPNRRPTFPTMLACCKARYDGQTSGKCLSKLPSPPTSSPSWSPTSSPSWSPGTGELPSLSPPPPSSTASENKLPSPPTPAPEFDFWNLDDDTAWSVPPTTSPIASASKTDFDTSSPSPPTSTVDLLWKLSLLGFLFSSLAFFAKSLLSLSKALLEDCVGCFSRGDTRRAQTAQHAHGTMSIQSSVPLHRNPDLS